MLTLILGKSGTGRTSELMSRLKNATDEKRRAILLVPEQSSSSAESKIYKALSDEGSAFAKVCSFRTLAENIEDFYGGKAKPTLTDAGRVVFVRRALSEVMGNLTIYSKQKGVSAFCSMCADTIKELKTAGVNGDELEKIANEQGNDKFKELSIIFKSYESVCSGSVLDSADRLTLAANVVGEDFFEGIDVFIDEFDGFTAPEYAMLKKIIAHTNTCTVTLCCDSLQDYDNGMGIFSPVKKTANRLIDMAKRQGVTVKAPVVKEDILRSDKKGLVLLNTMVSTGAVPIQMNNDGLYVTGAGDIYNEANLCAWQIRKLYASGVKMKNIAVICRDIESYSPAVLEAFRLAKIPFFKDSVHTIEHTAPISFIRSALDIAKNGISSRRVLALLKTGLCDIDINALSALENYAYTWEPTGVQWRETFAQNPEGFKGVLSEKSQEQLALAEDLRQNVIAKILEFTESVKNSNGANISRQLYLLLDRFSAPTVLQKVAQQFKNDGDLPLYESTLRGWDIAMDMLNEMSNLLGSEALSVGEYDELFLLLCRQTEVGYAPQSLDSVTFTSADRMRLGDIDYAFVLGLNEEVFPSAVGFSGLLSHSDRELLIEQGAEMPGGFENRVLLEQMFFYRALVSPKKALYMSYCTHSKGSAMVMCAPLCKIVEVFAPQNISPEIIYKSSTPLAGADFLSEQWRNPTAYTESIKSAIAQNHECENLVDLMEDFKDKKTFEVVNKDTIKKVLTNNLTTSPSKIERYHTCRFGYFIEHVLRIKPRAKAQLSPMESGSFVHYLLEKAITNAGEDFLNLSEEDLAKICSEIASEYIKENMLGVSGKRFEYLLSRLEKSVTSLLLYIQAEQKQSSFHPVAFEQKIGYEGVPPLKFTLDTGENISVIGTIDRVDTMEREGKTYVRVLDYKTGSKSFSLEDVYCGLNTQMLIYLFTLKQNGFGGDSIPSGVLYLLSDPAPVRDKRDSKGDKTPYSVDGLILNDALVIHGMDKNKDGFFVPIAYKDDIPKLSNKLASIEKMGNIERHIENLVLGMARSLFDGKIEALPLCKKDKTPCEYCDYRSICLHEDTDEFAEITAPKDVFEDDIE